MCSGEIPVSGSSFFSDFTDIPLIGLFQARTCAEVGDTARGLNWDGATGVRTFCLLRSTIPVLPFGVTHQ